MDNNEEIKDEEIEVVVEKEEPTAEKIEEKVEHKKEECACHTKVLDNWLFFCFDVLLLIFVLGISIFILDIRVNLKQLNQKADRIEEHYQDAEVIDWTEPTEGEPEEIVDTTTESTTESSTDTTEVTQ